MTALLLATSPVTVDPQNRLQRHHSFNPCFIALWMCCLKGAKDNELSTSQHDASNRLHSNRYMNRLASNYFASESYTSDYNFDGKTALVHIEQTSKEIAVFSSEHHMDAGTEASTDVDQNIYKSDVCIFKCSRQQSDVCIFKCSRQQ